MRYFKIHWVSFLILSLGIFFASPIILCAEEDSLPIEGIVYEPKNPAQSSVVIDGELYQKGMSYQNHEILEIHPSYVLAKNSAGIASRFQITGSIHPAVLTAPEKLPPSDLKVALPKPPEADTLKTASIAEPSQGLGEQFKNIFKNLNPATVMNYAGEISVMADLRDLYVKASIAMSESNDNNISLENLIEKGDVDPIYKEGKDNYQFRVEAGKLGVQIFADPIQNPEKSRHFMIDEEGKMRSEDNAPATEKSPLVRPPSWMNNFTQSTAALKNNSAQRDEPLNS